MAMVETARGGSIEIATSNHYVDWGAILAGVFISLAISTVFLAFGSALGLSASGLLSGTMAPTKGLIVAGALWLLWVQVSSFLGGGYVTGRLRCKIGDAEVHEVEIRDGMHGLIVWGVNLTISAAIASWLVLASGTEAVNVASRSDALAYSVDRLVRSDTIQPEANIAQINNAKAEISRVLAKSIVAVTLDDADKAFLFRAIESQSGLTEADALKRIEVTISSLKAQAEAVRRYAILLAFLTAASFLVSAVAAWWAAASGGKHRDDGIDHSKYARWS